MTLQTALKQLRAELNINQKTLAQLIGIDATTLNRWENGRIKPQRVSALLLLSFAKERGLSEGCQNSLREALFPKYKIEAEVNDLRTTEIAKINELVNNSSNGVVVIDMDSYDILYTNNTMLEIEDRIIEEVKTMKCYEFLRQGSQPCSTCQESCGGRDEFLESEYHSLRTGKHYLIRSREIMWSDRWAQLKYITDATEMHHLREEANYLRDSLHIAASQAGMSVFLYEIKAHRARMVSKDENYPNMPDYLDNFPQVVFEDKKIVPAYLLQYKKMLHDIESGSEHAEAEVQVKADEKTVHWTRFQMHLTKKDKDGLPELAVCSVVEIDKEKSMERRVHFEHQKVLEEGKGLLTYVVSNLTQNKTMENRYFGEDRLPVIELNYDKAIEAGCKCLVQEKDVALFLKLHNRKRLIENFEKGIQTYSQEYQLQTNSGHIIWANNTLNLYQDTQTGEIYLYEYCFDIFEQKLLDGMLTASRLYHYDAFGMIFLNNGQLTKIIYQQDRKTHTTELISYEEEARLLGSRYIVEEDRYIQEPYTKLAYLRKQLEENDIVSLMFRIRMQDGMEHRMLERISWYDRENQVCLISILDVDKTAADIE